MTRFVLDGDPDGRLRGTIKQEGGGLTIYVDGYGDSQPVAGLVYQDGKLKLLAFPEIRNEEPVTVELQGAKEWP